MTRGLGGGGPDKGWLGRALREMSFVLDSSPLLPGRSTLRSQVARLVPACPIRSREQARAAIRRIRDRAEQRKLGPFDWSEWKSCREEARPCFPWRVITTTSPCFTKSSKWPSLFFASKAPTSRNGDSCKLA